MVKRNKDKRRREENENTVGSINDELCKEKKIILLGGEEINVDRS